MKIQFNNQKQINLEELRKLIYTSWYSVECDKERWLERELIINEIKDNHGCLATIYFSLSGSPPKGRAILIKDYDIERDSWVGDLLLIGRKNKWIREVQIVQTDISN